jgi:hypothetical protein
LLRATPFLNFSGCFEAASDGMGGNADAAKLAREPAFGVAA